MATLLKESNGTLTYDDVTTTVARAKTLNIFRKLDTQHNARIIRFRHEAKELYDTEKRRSLDLSTAKLPDIEFRDLAVNEKHLHNLSLTRIFLSNATFVNIQAKNINFANNQFDNVNCSDPIFDKIFIFIDINCIFSLPIIYNKLLISDCLSIFDHPNHRILNFQSIQ